MITLFLGICRLGFLDVVLSRPLLRGFITAVGIIILIEQVSGFIVCRTRRMSLEADDFPIARAHARPQPPIAQRPYPDSDKQAGLPDTAH
jgi:hypothetical protein